MSAINDRLADRILGARVVAVDEHSPVSVWLILEHRGTDDDECRVLVDARSVQWRDPETGEYAVEQAQGEKP